MLSTKDLEFKNANILKANRWKKISYSNHNNQRTCLVMLTSDKIDFKVRNNTREKRGTFHNNKV